MKKRQSNMFQTMTVGCLITLALVSTPVSADHDHSIVVPAVAFIALSSIFYHSHHRHHHYKRHHYGHQPRHSSSYGGYHNPKRGHYGHGGNHNQKRNHYSRN